MLEVGMGHVPLIVRAAALAVLLAPAASSEAMEGPGAPGPGPSSPPSQPPPTSPPPTFGVLLTPAEVTLRQGESATSIVTLSGPAGGFSGPVSLTATGLPQNVVASSPAFSPDGASTVTLQAADDAALGRAGVTFTVSDGTWMASTTLTLDVTIASAAGGGGARTAATAGGCASAPLGAPGDLALLGLVAAAGSRYGGRRRRGGGE